MREMKKADAYPMHKAPRCTARSKRTGEPCKNPAVKGWSVCRMHGARGGSKPGKASPAYKHGGRTKEAVELQKLANALAKCIEDFPE
ncbi:HGGxSTG domain-containing protein [Roseibium sp.]|uniref:HGGxSTG domain-containing protein n=1 Tax=Roseibium sp. TaxID=1936156 RepID=UPI003BA8BD01